MVNSECEKCGDRVVWELADNGLGVEADGNLAWVDIKGTCPACGAQHEGYIQGNIRGKLSK